MKAKIGSYLNIICFRTSFINDNLLKNESEYNKIDWTQLIANDSSDEEKYDTNELEDKRAKLLSSNNNHNSDFDKSRKRKNDIDMEITFNTGLDELGNTILENSKHKNEGVWDKHLRKKRESKENLKREKELRKLASSNEYLLDDE
jgi:hypothetical protein